MKTKEKKNPLTGVKKRKIKVGKTASYLKCFFQMKGFDLYIKICIPILLRHIIYVVFVVVVEVLENFLFPGQCLSSARLQPLQVSVLLVGHVPLHVLHGDDPAVDELPVQRRLLLLHLRLHLHHVQRGVVMVAVLHRGQLLRQVLLAKEKTEKLT